MDHRLRTRTKLTMITAYICLTVTLSHKLFNTIEERPAYVISTNMVQSCANRSPAMMMMAQRKRAGAISNPWVAFLLLAGDIHPNPGPGRTNWKYPYNVCEKPVKRNQDGLQCDECDLWTHLKCVPAAIHMTTAEYHRISQAEDKYLIVSTYKPPNITNNIFKHEMSSMLDKSIANYSDMWVIGDLNFDMFHQTKGETLRDICDLYGLEQLITEPTNLTPRGLSLIDVILTTAPRKSSSSGSVNVGISDSHNMIIYNVKAKSTDTSTKNNNIP